MANTPDVTRTLYNVSKNYLSSTYQQGQTLYDWMYNSDMRELVFREFYQISKICSGKIITDTHTGFNIEVAGIPGNDFVIKSGSACVNGRIVTNAADINYSDELYNYLVTGSITTITELVPATTYRLYDEEKKFSANYNLPGCRFIITSGALSGSEFGIVSLVGQGIVISGDLSTLAVDDTYIIAPPEIITPTSNETVVYSLVTWIEDISELEDTTLTDPVFQDSPIHKNQLRWCVFPDWVGSESTDPSTGFCVLELATVERLTGDTSIDTVDITNSDNLFYTAQHAYTQIVETTADADEALDILQLANEHDYQTTRTASPFFSIEDENITFDDFRLLSPNQENKDTLQHQAELTGDVIANATVSHSSLLLEPTIDDTGATLAQTTSTEVGLDDLCVLALVGDSGAPSDVLRSNPMGDHRLWSRGFDWVCKYDPTIETTIMPGEFFRWGQLHQLVDQYTFDHTNAANWENTTLPSGSAFCYLYLKPTTTLRRDLTPMLSELAPKWNGEHPIEKAHCIGIFYWNNITPTNPQYKRGNKWYCNGVSVYSSATGAMATVSGIPGMVEECGIECTVTTTNAGTIWYIQARYDNSTTDYYNQKQVMTADINDFKYFNVPNVGEIEVTVSNLGLDTCIAYLKSCTLKDIYTPSQFFWR